MKHDYTRTLDQIVTSLFPDRPRLDIDQVRLARRRLHQTQCIIDQVYS